MFYLFSCAPIKQEKNDYNVITEIISGLCTIENDTLMFDINADNVAILSVYEENLADSIFIMSERNIAWLTKNTKSTNEENILLLRDIFNEENYIHIKPQTGSFTWHEAEIVSFSSCKIVMSESRNSSTPNLYISKPVYTKDNYALVYYKYNNISMMSVLRKKQKKWTEIKLLPIGINSTKVSLFK